MLQVRKVLMKIHQRFPSRLAHQLVISWRLVMSVM
jgi:hypothetical protein